ncbi:MAG: hypothetical protein HZC46_10430 [Ignavibacterium album]|uniref:hypothetical protein n=1 Tax=Ignavibacterium album TaxID=591197 RepID=UPI0026EB07B9|nr:hypothetical protein [Ignavibacterium album]MBI5662549.1 hypothetical protein [Ignavibacterium album]
MSLLNTDKKIILQTRKGNNISNFQNPEISEFNKNYFAKIESQYKNAKKRSEPTGLYNCHGMTFASRRCFIEDPNEILMILKEDDYCEINYKDVLPGDIIVYFSNGDVEHSGVVVEEPKKPLYVPLIFSKWSVHSEFIHFANDCPYDKTNIKYYRIFK